MVTYEHDITLKHIWEAKKRISLIISKTPLIASSVLNDQLGTFAHLKLENFHEIGAFKIRGAANKLLSLSNQEKAKGVTTFSTGNHGLAVAFVAQQLGLKAVICVSHRVPEAKINRLNRLGANVQIVGNSQDDAEQYCYRLQEERGLSVIKPFDDPHVIAGQGTIGLEMIDDLPDIDMAIIPVSGGGLFAGIAYVLKQYNPSIQLIGVSMEHSAVMYESLRAKKPVILEEQNTLADSLLGGIGLDNTYTFPLVQKYIDDFVLVSEKEIATAMKFIAEEHRYIVEGAAATGIAAMLSKKVDVKGKKVATIITGNNVDISVLKDIL